MKKTNVLIFPSGAENAINVYDSLKYNLHFELYGASSKKDHSSYIFDENHFSLGDYNIKDKNFIKNFNKLIKNKNIEYVIPTHDEISAYLMRNNDLINATIVCSPSKTCDIALSKLETAKILQGKDYYPKTYAIDEEISYPVFLKPDIGAGAKDTHVVDDLEQLKDLCQTKKYLICELLPGEEITVDCFTNKDRKLLFIGPRTRNRITSGIAFNSENIELTEEIKNIAEDLNNTFEFRGLWFFQLKKDKNGSYKLLEFSVRTAGTMALYRQLGINFAALSLFDFMGYEVSIIKNNFNIQLDRYYKCTYLTDILYDNVYLDFDDTLIIRDKVNSEMMKLIYQWHNDGKNIYLITKHATDIYEDLTKYKIDKSLFKEIILLKETDKKSDYITETKSIFIDNYFKERIQVFESKKIPVFDVDAIECLVNTLGV